MLDGTMTTDAGYQRATVICQRKDFPDLWWSQVIGRINQPPFLCRHFRIFSECTGSPFPFQKLMCQQKQPHHQILNIDTQTGPETRLKKAQQTSILNNYSNHSLQLSQSVHFYVRSALYSLSTYIFTLLCFWTLGWEDFWNWKLGNMLSLNKKCLQFAIGKNTGRGFTRGSNMAIHPSIHPSIGGRRPVTQKRRQSPREATTGHLAASKRWKTKGFCSAVSNL